MKKYGFFLVAFCFLFLSFTSIPFQDRNPVVERIQGWFQKMQDEFPVEKVHLHLDRHQYTLGEDVWFKAYLTAGSTQIPTPLSGTLYVDLFDATGALIQQKKIKIENGTGHGEIKLPQFTEEGIFQIKAYTAWMRNFGEEYFFQEKIKVSDAEAGVFQPAMEFKTITSDGSKVSYQSSLLVLDSQGEPFGQKQIDVHVMGENQTLYSEKITLNTQGEANLNFSIPEKPFAFQQIQLTYWEDEAFPIIKSVRLPYAFSLADVQFLPEGGQLLQGKKNNVAFRGVYPDGEPADFSGELMVEGMEQAVVLESWFGGMGKFEMVPAQTKPYTVRLKEKKSGQEKEVVLPAAKAKGLTMQVANNPAANYVTVFIQGDSDYQNLILVSQTRGIINYMIGGALNNGIWGVRIPRSNLISGINQITVLTADGQALMERLVFIHTDEHLQLSLDESQKGSLGERAEVKLRLKSQHQDTPVPANFSVSIIDFGQVEEEGYGYKNIFSSLLMDSDLKGNIYSPGYYFKDRAPETLEALDLVMLTHGWTRFEWEDVLSEKFPTIDHFIEQGINLEGNVVDPNGSKKGLGGGAVSAMVGQGLEIISSEYGENGRFIFMGMDYQDTMQITITAKDKRLSENVEISVEVPQPVLDRVGPSFKPEFKFPKSLAEGYRERQLMQRMQEDPDLVDLEAVTIQDERIDVEMENIQKIYGNGDVSLDPSKILGAIAFTNVFQMIQGRVSGVQVLVNGPNASVLIRGVGSLMGGTEPLYLLDNQPVDAGTLLLVNPQDVAVIDVFKDPARAAIFGAQGANGAIAVYTKRGSGIADFKTKGKLVTRYGGYASPKEFYHPKYDQKSVSTALNDKRTTLYWEPNLQTSVDGSVEFAFYNSDIAKKHLIVIEGMDASGRIGRLEKLME
ncbi:TonB-dependent receptor plug domain-containing protein [Pararhodonellum marinum]|uniref:TonB-dependent receptor plug domain-containing protein n=1 Tax=Pararhodonellum marinum TaxID=2755358 RepID=UPI00188F421C|nr:TonB-dependent receptor plug domain-containing protein [Pararhodonellum marinum]